MNYSKTMRVIGVAVLCLTSAGFVQAADGPVRITVTGSSTIAPLMGELGKAFEKTNPTVRVDVQTGGTSRGITDVRQGSADIGMVSRALYDNEKDLQSVLIARDGICMLVNKSNPIQKLSRAQVIDIYSGKIANWKSVGGLDMPITVISKAEGRSTLEIFSHYFGLSSRAIRAQIIIGDNQQEIQTVSSSKGAIGYVSIGSAEYEAKSGASIKLLQLDDFTPSTENVASGRYPISRDLNLVYRKPLSKDAQEFIDFAQSQQANKYIVEQFFIPPGRQVIANKR